MRSENGKWALSSADEFCRCKITSFVNLTTCSQFRKLIGVKAELFFGTMLHFRKILSWECFLMDPSNVPTKMVNANWNLKRNYLENIIIQQQLCLEKLGFTSIQILTLVCRDKCIELFPYVHSWFQASDQMYNTTIYVISYWQLWRRFRKNWWMMEGAITSCEHFYVIL